MAQSNMTRTVGLALEGGGYRGMYTAGVLDVWMEHGLTCDHMVGVSAGAAFGYNFKSRQIGRAIRYNKAYCADKRYASVYQAGCEPAICSMPILPITRCLSSAIPSTWRHIAPAPCDLRACVPISRRARPSTTTCPMAMSAISSGSGRRRRFPWRRVLSPLRAAKYLDGGVADSIPSAWLFAQGYDRNIVVLTQPAGFVKQPNSVMPMLRRVFRHYPEFVAALEHRHEVYNATLDDLARREAAGEIFCGAAERIGEGAVAVPRTG